MDELLKALARQVSDVGESLILKSYYDIGIFY
jgi:hypothetical protein